MIRARSNARTRRTQRRYIAACMLKHYQFLTRGAGMEMRKQLWLAPEHLHSVGEILLETRLMFNDAFPDREDIEYPAA